MQYVKRDKYIDKTIDEVSFLVQNHPLDQYFKTQSSFTGRTHVTVYLLDGTVFGGFSFPESIEALYGAPYSLDGKSAEEIKAED